MPNLLSFSFWYRSTIPKRDSVRKWQSMQCLFERYFKIILFSCCLWYKIIWWINDSDLSHPLQKLIENIYHVSVHTCTAMVIEGSQAGVQEATMATWPRVAE